MVNQTAPPRSEPQAKGPENILDFVLNENSTVEMLSGEHANTTSTTADGMPVAPPQNGRTKTRVLFIATDTVLLEPHTELREKLASLNSVFEEVHIMVIRSAWKKQTATEKVTDRVWVYSTTAQHWWQTLAVAESVVREQLMFGEGFRPDIIVALDPFASGYVGLKLAEAYERPFQVHLLNDIFTPDFKQTRRHGSWLLRLARHVLSRTKSICVATDTIKERVKERFPHLDPILLPRYHNLDTVAKVAHTTAVKPGKLMPYKFIILYVGRLDHDSTLYRGIDAARNLLRSPAIAMVVIGDGPMKKEFKKRAEILGIAEQVIFEPSTVDLISYMRSSDLLLATDTTKESDDVVVKAAAVGLPVLAAHTALRDEMFTDGENAFLAEKEDTIEFSQKLSKFLNNNAIRVQFARASKTSVKDRLHEDPQVYKVAYRDAIESVLDTLTAPPSEGK